MGNLTERHVKLMQHCIGMDMGQKKPYKRHGKLFFKPYRNYFCTHEQCNDYTPWMEIKAAGLSVDKFSNKGSEYVSFHLNSKGMEWLGNRLGVTIYTDKAKPFDLEVK